MTSSEWRLPRTAEVMVPNINVCSRNATRDRVRARQVTPIAPAWSWRLKRYGAPSVFSGFVILLRLLFDPAPWPQTLGEIAADLGSSAARLFLYNNDPRQNGFGSSVGIDMGFNEKFDNDFETLNSIKYAFVIAHLDQAMTLAEILGTNGGRDIYGNEPMAIAITRSGWFHTDFTTYWRR